MDGKNKSTTFELLDGELKKEYKSFKVTLQVIDKSNGSGSTVKSVVEYEKQNENVPSPNKYFGFAHVLYKNIDTYLINNA